MTLGFSRQPKFQLKSKGIRGNGKMVLEQSSLTCVRHALLVRPPVRGKMIASAARGFAEPENSCVKS